MQYKELAPFSAFLICAEECRGIIPAYRSKEIENTIPSIVYCIYSKGLFGKYKTKELIDLLYSCKDMTVTEVLTPRNITKVLHRYFRGHEYVDNPSKKPIIDLQYVKKYIEDSFNIKHVEITK